MRARRADHPAEREKAEQNLRCIWDELVDASEDPRPDLRCLRESLDLDSACLGEGHGGLEPEPR